MELNFLFLDFYILSMSITNMITVIKNIKQFQIFIRYDTFGFRKLYINLSLFKIPCFELYRIFTLTFLFIAFCMIITLPQIPTSSAYRRLIFISSLLSFWLETRNKKVNSHIQKIKANLVKISIDKYLTQAYNLILESSMTIFRHLILRLGNKIAM